eukprot:6438926-Prorocentrum_lima.AAC.1
MKLQQRGAESMSSAELEEMERQFALLGKEAEKLTQRLEASSANADVEMAGATQPSKHPGSNGSKKKDRS